jgi:hypothetical protein
MFGRYRISHSLFYIEIIGFAFGLDFGVLNYFRNDI